MELPTDRFGGTVGLGGEDKVPFPDTHDFYVLGVRSLVGFDLYLWIGASLLRQGLLLRL